MNGNGEVQRFVEETGNCETIRTFEAILILSINLIHTIGRKSLSCLIPLTLTPSATANFFVTVSMDNLSFFLHLGENVVTFDLNESAAERKEPVQGEGTENGH